MKALARIVPALAFAVFSTAAISAPATTEFAGTSSPVAQPQSRRDGEPSAIGNPRYRAQLEGLRQEKIIHGVMLASAVCASNCRFYGGQY
jgi:hypothetical protein